MVRLRLAKFVLAAGLGVVCGCTSLSQCPLLDRFRGHAVADPYNGGIVTEGAGPVIEGAPMDGMVPNGPPMDGVVPNAPPIGAVPSVTPQNTIPSLTPPPRIVPQPQSAQPAPYTP